MTPVSFPPLFTIFLAVVAALAAQPARGQQPEATRIATFEIVATELKEPIAEAGQSMLPVLNDRLAAAGRARVADDGQIEVELYGNLTPKQYDAILRRLTTVGLLEFRITASRQFEPHQSIIELAEKLSVDQASVRIDDKEFARWVKCDDKEFRTMEEAAQRDMVARKAGDAIQALVLTDDGLDVTGDSLKSVEAGIDAMGKPDLRFAFNPKGAFLFGQLTGNHLPTANQQFNLGIVLDDRLLSAPTIVSKITDRGTISGNMTQAEIDFLASVLHAGRLPFPLHLVAERSVAK